METPFFVACVNAPELPSKDKHRVIFETFEALASGTTMELINDHDPQPLYYEFKMEREGTFEWDYMRKALRFGE